MKKIYHVFRSQMVTFLITYFYIFISLDETGYWAFITGGLLIGTLRLRFGPWFKSTTTDWNCSPILLSLPIFLVWLNFSASHIPIILWIAKTRLDLTFKWPADPISWVLKTLYVVQRHCNLTIETSEETLTNFLLLEARSFSLCEEIFWWHIVSWQPYLVAYRRAAQGTAKQHGTNNRVTHNGHCWMHITAT